MAIDNRGALPLFPFPSLAAALCSAWDGEVKANRAGLGLTRLLFLPFLLVRQEVWPAGYGFQLVFEPLDGAGIE